MARVLSKTFVFPVGGKSVTYLAGTPEDALDPAHAEALASRNVWEDPDAAGLDADVTVTEYDAPADLDAMNPDELRRVAEYHGVGLGRLRDPEKIRAVLREAGVGVD